MVKTFDKDDRIVEVLGRCESFSKLRDYDQTIEFLQGWMRDKFNEEDRAKLVFALIEAYIQHGEYAKAKSMQERFFPLKGADSSADNKHKLSNIQRNHVCIWQDE